MAPKTIARNARPSSQRPMANFIGVEGLAFFRSSQIQSHEKTGANSRIPSGFTDWYQAAGKPPPSFQRPKSVRSVWSSAKTVIELPACSKADQKKMLPKNARMKMTASFDRSPGRCIDRNQAIDPTRMAEKTAVM